MAGGQTAAGAADIDRGSHVSKAVQGAVFHAHILAADYFDRISACAREFDSHHSDIRASGQDHQRLRHHAHLQGARSFRKHHHYRIVFCINGILATDRHFLRDIQHFPALEVLALLETEAVVGEGSRFDGFPWAELLYGHKFARPSETKAPIEPSFRGILPFQGPVFLESDDAETIPGLIADIAFPGGHDRIQMQGVPVRPLAEFHGAPVRKKLRPGRTGKVRISLLAYSGHIHALGIKQLYPLCKPLGPAQAPFRDAHSPADASAFAHDCNIFLSFQTDGFLQSVGALLQDNRIAGGSLFDGPVQAADAAHAHTTRRQIR